MRRIAILGASGYAGAELFRLCLAHPELDVAWVAADTSAGTLVRELYPNLAAVAGDVEFIRYDPDLAEDLDAVFLALPHGASASVVPDLMKRAGVVVDLSADFRLKDAALYDQWYGAAHPAPELLADFAYGLPELFRPALAGASAIAVPGCYPTAAALALTPLLRAGLVEPTGVIVDAATGVSGAGRPAKATTTFCTVDEDFRAYGLIGHRHTPEIEQATGASVLFTPHLAPMNRGILATCYARPAPGASGEAVQAALADAYRHEPFVVVGPESPSTKATAGSNCAHLTARHDPRTGWVMVLCALDNLVKGAAGQAVQCANLALGLDETTGLPLAGVAP